ncbi:plasmid stability protein [Streptomyces sp. V4I23]|uniref:FitA-like ribbon-helix-helix domain-containing protein n=1 Tax=Streptomyces sp. V4I23 TaxID=3042282 RepID=UPI00278B9F30|nr:antitoxin [Streptomyces sp. V4I23]MDQ1008807.1 plasmid stability protein [Streptomyces sp. V4I23]
MATLYVRDLPEEVLTELKIRAARNHQSLQAYARSLLEQEAATPAIEDVVARIRARATARLSTGEVLQDIDRGRRHE